MDILGIANECIVEIEKRHLDGCGEPIGTIEGVENAVLVLHFVPPSLHVRAGPAHKWMLFQCGTPKMGPISAARFLHKEMLKVYSDNIVDVVFGEGPLGFRVGELESGVTIVAGFSDKNDEGCNLLHVRLRCWFCFLGSLHSSAGVGDRLHQQRGCNTIPERIH